jgi:hypothetical protein
MAIHALHMSFVKMFLRSLVTKMGDAKRSILLFIDKYVPHLPDTVFSAS